MPPDGASLLALTQATATAPVQLMLAAPKSPWAAALRQLGVLKQQLAQTVARLASDDRPA